MSAGYEPPFVAPKDCDHETLDADEPIDQWTACSRCCPCDVCAADRWDDVEADGGAHQMVKEEQ